MMRHVFLFLLLNCINFLLQLHQLVIDDWCVDLTLTCWRRRRSRSSVDFFRGIWVSISSCYWWWAFVWRDITGTGALWHLGKNGRTQLRTRRCYVIKKPFVGSILKHQHYWLWMVLTWFDMFLLTRWWWPFFWWKRGPQRVVWIRSACGLLFQVFAEEGWFSMCTCEFDHGPTKKAGHIVKLCKVHHPDCPGTVTFNSSQWNISMLAGSRPSAQSSLKRSTDSPPCNFWDLARRMPSTT